MYVKPPCLYVMTPGIINETESTPLPGESTC